MRSVSLLLQQPYLLSQFLPPPLPSWGSPLPPRASLREGIALLMPLIPNCRCARALRPLRRSLPFPWVAPSAPTAAPLPPLPFCFSLPTAAPLLPYRYAIPFPNPPCAARFCAPADWFPPILPQSFPKSDRNFSEMGIWPPGLHSMELGFVLRLVSNPSHQLVT
jgi:hypothetical protein